MIRRAHVLAVALVWATAVRAGEAPDFAAKTLAGDAVQLSDYRGRVVLVDFWSTWCPPCKPQLAALAALEKDNLALVVLAVNVDSRRDKVVRFVERNPVPKRVVLDPQAAIPARYDAQGMPWSVLVDAQGKVVSQHAALDDAGRAALADEVRRLQRGARD